MWRKMDSEYTIGVLETPGDKSNRFAEQVPNRIRPITKTITEIGWIKSAIEIMHKRQNEVEKEIKRVEAAIDIANKQQKTNEERSADG